LIVVLSREAVSSYWVAAELGIRALLLTLADSRLSWDKVNGRFDPDRSNAALEVLTRPGVLNAEPSSVNVSRATPWDPDTPVFRNKVTELAALIQGRQ
jgi:hypothetical protein